MQTSVQIAHYDSVPAFHVADGQPSSLQSVFLSWGVAVAVTFLLVACAPSPSMLYTMSQANTLQSSSTPTHVPRAGRAARMHVTRGVRGHPLAAGQGSPEDDNLPPRTSFWDTPILDANDRRDQGPVAEALKKFVRAEPEVASVTFSVVVVIILLGLTRLAISLL